jgi:hypothetical protein
MIHGKQNIRFDVHVTVHRRHSEGKEPTRCDRVCSFIASTCFGHQYSHHQEYLPDTRKKPYTHTTNDPRPPAFTSLTNSLLAKPLDCNTLHHNTRAYNFAYLFQVWPPKSRSYLLIVLLMMGILVPVTCWGNKTAYFVASGWFYTFTVSTMHGHRNIK